MGIKYHVEVINTNAASDKFSITEYECEAYKYDTTTRLLRLFEHIKVIDEKKTEAKVLCDIILSIHDRVIVKEKKKKNKQREK